jgi:hypothetical protein
MPVGLIGMLGLIVAVEQFLAARALEFTGNSVLLDWRTTGRAASSREVRRSEVLCFGDSLVKHGIYPPILEASLGRPAFNLAIPAAPPPASYFLLRRALDAGARPRAVIVDAHAMLLPSRPGLSAGYWPELLTVRELLELSLVARDSRLFTRAALEIALPSARYREAIRARVCASLRGHRPPGAELYPVLLRNWRVNRGATVSSPRRPPDALGGSDPDAADPREGPGTVAWFAYRVNTVYLRKLLDLAAARGVAVFWLLPPTSPTHLARTERSGVDARYTAFVRETQARYANVVVFDGRRAGYRREVFSDLTHLDRRGASALSEAVASFIAPYLSGGVPPRAPRWAELPPYRARPELVPLEDVEQSMAASRASDRLHR